MVQGLRRAVVAPYPDDRPSGTAQRLIGFAITLYVSGQLRRPVPIVDLRRPSMLGAAMPEAAIHKYRHALTREDDVRLESAAMDNDGVILSEAVAQLVEGRAQADLRLGVRPADRLHVSRPALGRRGRMNPGAPGPLPRLGAPISFRHADGLRSQMPRSVTGSWQGAFERLFESQCGHGTTVGELRN
jgi:hypothetical protein